MKTCSILAAALLIAAAAPALAEHPHPIGTVCLPQVGYNPERNRNAWDACRVTVPVDRTLCPVDGYGFMSYRNDPTSAAINRGDIEALAAMMHNADIRASAAACTER